MIHSQENNKRILKNTIMLYFRMILTMVISLYTVRVLLGALGLVDYGLFNLIGGLISFMSFLTLTLSSASQRYLSFSLGTNNYKEFQQIFSMNILLYIILAVIIIFLCETIGLWFLNNHLKLPPSRISAALWLFHFTVATFIVNLLIVPYHAAILSYEKMSVYAYVSILDAVLKLLIVYLVASTSNDKLVYYGFLLLVQSFLVGLIYVIYSQKKLEGCRFKYYWDKELFRQLGKYTGWTMFGSLSGTLNNQGLAIVLNMFFGPTINAAKGISDRVSSAVTIFISSFYSAVKPQIVKSYAVQDYNYMKILVFQSSKLSFYIMFLLVLPIILETEYILTLWLGEIETSMIIFTQLSLLFSLMNVFEFPLTQMIQASGNVKKYQFIVGMLTLLTLPVSYTLLYLGYPAEIALVTLIFIYLLAYIPRLIIINKMFPFFSIKEYISKVITRIIVVTCISSTLPVIFHFYLNYGLTRFLINIFISFISICLTVFLIGVNNSERGIIINFFKRKFLAMNSNKVNTK